MIIKDENYVKRSSPAILHSRTIVRDRSVMRGMLESTSVTGHARDLFPFPNPREGQDRFLEDARRTLGAGRHLLAHAPTGLGKTAVALTASLEIGVANGFTTFFLTSRQSQHRIAIETVRRMPRAQRDIFVVDIISKQSLCPLPANPSISFQELCDLKVAENSCQYHSKSSEPMIDMIRRNILHVDEVSRLCRIFGRCPHKTAMDCLKEADLVVCDYNYIFSNLQKIVLRRADRALNDIVLVVDEAHNLPSRIRDHLTGVLGVATILGAAKEVKQHDCGLSRSLIRFAQAFRSRPSSDPVEVPGISLVGPLSRALDGLSVKEFVEWIEKHGENLERRSNSYLLELSGFLRGWMDGKNPILRSRDGEEYSYMILDPSVLSQEVFEKVPCSIFMSGTLFPAETYVDLLGMPRPRCVLRTYPSPFPRQNREVILDTKVTTLYRRRGDRTYQAYADLTARIAKKVPGNLAVFFPSYKFLDEVRCRLECSSELIIEHQGSTKAEKNDVLRRLKGLQDDGAILLAVMGGSLSEGVDFRDNLLSGVIICGIPLMPPDLKNEAIRRYLSSRFGVAKGFDYAYLMPAMNKVLQAAGRCIRSETDRAVTVFADSRFASGRYIRFLPEDLRCSGKDLNRAIGEFFAA